MYSRNALKNDLNISNMFRTMNYKKEFFKKNPSYFPYDGSIVFTGPQGSGKTLSGVNYVCELLSSYPNARLCTNTNIKDFPIVDFEKWLFHYSKSVRLNFESLSDDYKNKILNDYYYINRIFPFYGGDDLKRYNNYDEGMIYFIDEIQLYFNSLESKNISMDVITEISQQRKQRKHIVCTSQVFGRLAKPLREQFNAVVVCKCLFNCFQYNRFYLQEDLKSDDDYMHFQGRCDKINFFFHRPSMYDNYDTYFKVQNLKFNYEGGTDIYERNSNSSDRNNN